MGVFIYTDKVYIDVKTRNGTKFKCFNVDKITDVCYMHDLKEIDIVYDRFVVMYPTVNEHDFESHFNGFVVKGDIKSFCKLLNKGGFF